MIDKFWSVESEGGVFEKVQKAVELIGIAEILTSL